MRTVEDLLKQPVKALALSDNFVLQCEKMGFERIADIVAVRPDLLIHRQGFSFHWLNELITFLKAENALHLLQSRLPTENISG